MAASLRYGIHSCRRRIDGGYSTFFLINRDFLAGRQHMHTRCHHLHAWLQASGHNHVIAESPQVKYFSTDDPLVSYLQVIEATDAAEVVVRAVVTGILHEIESDDRARRLRERSGGGFDRRGELEDNGVIRSREFQI